MNTKTRRRTTAFGATPPNRPRRFALVTALLLAAILTGCAGSALHRQGVSHLESGDYAEATRVLELEVARAPDNWKARRDLGVARFKSGDYAKARADLEEVLAVRPGDGATLFYLGQTCEQTGDLSQAIDTYRHFTRVSRLSSYRGTIEDRIRLLTREKALREARRRVAEEAALGAGPEPAEATIAVTPIGIAGTAESLAPLGAALSMWLTTDLAKIDRLSVLERLQLDALLRELQLAEGGQVDPETAPRVGRLLGARRLITGTLIGLEGDALRADLAVTDAATSETRFGAEADGSVEGFVATEKDLVFGLLASLEIEPTPRERAELERVPTRDLNAILAYGRGLLAERRGSLSEARASYRKALELDADFGLAGDALAALPSGDGDLSSVVEDPGEVYVGDDPEDLEDRLEETDDLTGGAFWPERPNDEVPPVNIPDTIPEPPPPPPTPSPPAPTPSGR